MLENQNQENQNAEKRNEVTNNQSVDDTTTIDYISAIKEIKEKSVSKEVYENLQKEHKQLLDAWVDGAKPVVAEKEVSNSELAKELASGTLNNLEYCKKALQLRKQIIDDGGIDPFVPQGHKCKATSEDYVHAENVASVLQECIDSCDGDNQLFTTKLQSRLN